MLALVRRDHLVDQLVEQAVEAALLAQQQLGEALQLAHGLDLDLGGAVGVVARGRRVDGGEGELDRTDHEHVAVAQVVLAEFLAGARKTARCGWPTRP